MTTVTVEKENVKTVAGSLAALDFTATLTPVFDNNGNEIDGFKRVYRPDRDLTLSIVSNQYKLVEHREAMAPAVEILGREGWAVDASRIEKNGASAFVQLTRKDASIKVVGEKVGERLMLRNSYDKSSSLTFTMGAIVLVCSNGAVVPGKGGMSFNGHHTGDLRENFDNFLKGLAKIEAGLAARMIEHYSQLDKLVPETIGREIIKRSIGERQEGTALQYWKTGIGRNGELNAWNLYNGVTQFLTHDYKGNWDRRERLNSQAFELIAGYVRTGVLPKEEEAN